METFDKKDWTPVTFGDVCRNVNDTEPDPLAAGIERYVGLEHIEPGSLHIKAWGQVSEGTTFTKKFCAGQVLFGKRRAYLRKAALADFDGICSGDILVLEAIEDLIDPALFPFLVQRDRFFDYAVQTSAGSLSPRTKFQDLAKFSFLLPPIEKQAKLAELMWVADDVVETKKQLSSQLEQILTITRDAAAGGKLHIEKSLADKPILNDRVSNLGDVITDIRYGTSQKSNSSTGFPVLRIPNVINEDINLEDLTYVEMSEAEFENTKLTNGDILIVRTNGNPSYVGRSALFTLEDEYTYASYLIKISVNKEVIIPEFVINYLQSTPTRRYFKVTLGHQQATITSIHKLSNKFHFICSTEIISCNA